MRTRLLFVRHGQTDWNVERRMQGHTDVPLNQTGLWQARKVAKYCGNFADKVSAIYTSDLQRASQTADEIAQHVPFSPIAHRGLREKHGGQAEGLNREEMEARYGPAPKGDRILPGAEDSKEFLARIRLCVDEIDRNHQGSTVIVVTHSGVIKAMIRHTSDVQLESLSIYNCCVAEFHYVGDQKDRQIAFIALHSY